MTLLIAIQLWFVLVLTRVSFCEEINCTAEDDLENCFIKYNMQFEPISVIPKEVLQVKFKGDLETVPGEHLSLDYFEHFLNVSWYEEPGYFYTLGFVDYDTLYLQWLVVNIPGNDIGSGKVLAEYIKPHLEDTDYHRCVLVLYRQNTEKANFKYNQKRKDFDIEAFADDNKIGNAVAANLFMVYNTQ